MITVELDLSGCTVGGLELVADRMVDGRLRDAGLSEGGEAIAPGLRDAGGADLVRVTIPLDVDDGSSLSKAKRWQAASDFLSAVYFELRHMPAEAELVQQLLNGLEPGATGEGPFDLGPTEDLNP